MSNDVMTVSEFAARHRACDAGRMWAENQADWDVIWKTARSNWLLWIATREDVLSRLELTAFVHFALKMFPDRSVSEDLFLASIMDIANDRFNIPPSFSCCVVDSDRTDMHYERSRALYLAWLLAAGRCSGTCPGYLANAAVMDVVMWHRLRRRDSGAESVYATDSDCEQHFLSILAEWLRKNTVPNFKRERSKHRDDTTIHSR